MYDFDYNIVNEFTLSNGVKKFKDSLKMEADIVNNRIISIQNNLINKLKLFLVNQVNESKENINKANVIESDFKLLINEVLESKSIYHNLSQTVEESKISLDLSKINYIANSQQNLTSNLTINNINKILTMANSQDFNGISSINKLKIKLDSVTCQAKEAENKYIKTLNQCNEYNSFYTKRIEEILDVFQSLESNYNKFLKEILIEYNIEIINGLEEQLKKSKECLDTLNKVNPEEDISKMIDKYQTNILPPSKFEFIPYLINSDKILKISKTLDHTYKHFNCSNIVNVEDISKNIKTFFKSNFLTELSDDLAISPNNIKVFNEIKNIVNNSWDGKTINNDTINLLKLYMKEKINRKFVLNCLNKYRINGLFILDSKSYNNISFLINTVLEYCDIENDYETMKFCMILSQTFYKPNDKTFVNYNQEFNKDNYHKDSFCDMINNQDSNNSKNTEEYNIKDININKDHNALELNDNCLLSKNSKNNNNTSTIEYTYNNNLNCSKEDKNKYINTTRNLLEEYCIIDKDNNKDKDKGIVSNNSVSININKNINNKLNLNEINITTNNTSKDNLDQNQSFIISAPRIFIQNSIQYNKALKNIKNWIGMIKFSIKEELSSKSGIYLTDNLANINLNSNIAEENKEAQIEMLKNISFGQLLSFSYNMTTFGFEKEKILEIISFFCKAHNISQEMQNFINTTFYECSEDIKETIRKSINDGNISHATKEDINSYLYKDYL